MQHRDYFRLGGQLEKIVVVPGVGTDGLAVALQKLNLAVDGEHFLDERPPKMQ